jgi:hypothetical protein
MKIVTMLTICGLIRPSGFPWIKATIMGPVNLLCPVWRNDIRGNAVGLKALDQAILRSADALIHKKDKYRFILDVDSTEGPAYGNQEGCVYNGHSGKSCFHQPAAYDHGVPFEGRGHQAVHGVADQADHKSRIALFLTWPALVGARCLIVSPCTLLQGGAWNGLKGIL